MIDLVEGAIKAAEEKNHSWILQGFPRTKVQALALQKMGIIPDKFMLLNIKPQASVARIKNNLLQITPSLYGAELEDHANNSLQEYDVHLAGVKEAFNQFIFEYDAQERPQTDVVTDLNRLLELRCKSGAPRRPPRIILAGPPGSGKYTQAKLAADAYGIIHVSVNELLKKEIAINRELGKTISAALDAGDEVPDHVVNRIIESRLSQTDCRVNGWILEGFPKSKAQVALLKGMSIKPAIVFILEQSEDESIRRMANKMVDPVTGKYYNHQVSPPSDETINSRLQTQACDSEEVVRKLCKSWRD